MTLIEKKKNKLINVLQDDKNVLIVVAQGIVPVLVCLLDSSSSLEIKEKTVTAIAKISTVASRKHVMIAEGLCILNNLQRVLEFGSVLGKENSCIALQAVGYTKNNARAIGSRGGISSFLEICQMRTSKTQAMAVGEFLCLRKFLR
ncbi:hypothetical protein MTR67_031172 [Solanum verrucosum]|uniref:Uncharacterized protein n=1 Tax=Solanum verrucosum TaxID=315347 RepID=A0AAF0ZEJ1_SOLVR|nr:uncharacterized protein LOC125824230 [Solanum verrucosum]WMV37787.1 hypothetical protein MTR67_031172 [Solanum verrucosum]